MKTITIDLLDDEAWAFAEFLKRVGYSDYRKLAINDQEAYEMQSAGEVLRKSLAEKGFAPR